MIGDGLGTDIAAARRVGARSVLMLTGVSTRAQSAPCRPRWPTSWPRCARAGAHPRRAALTVSAPDRQRLSGGEGVELGQQPGAQRLLVVEERDLEGVPVDAHSSESAAPAATARAYSAHEGQVADRAVVGRERDRHAGPSSRARGWSASDGTMPPGCCWSGTGRA